MYSNNDKVSIGQMINILILGTIGVGILTLPRDLAEIVGTDGWISLLIGGGLAMLIALANTYIIKCFPNKGLFQILEETLGKPIAWIVSLFLCLTLLGNIAFIVRIYEIVTKTLLLPRTPKAVLIIMMLLVVVYAVRVGIEPLGRISNIIFPISVILVVILFGLTLSQAEVSNLRPFLQSSPKDIFKTLNIVIYSLLGFELVLIFGVHINQPQKATLIAPITVGVVLLLYLLLNTLVLANFGEKQIIRLIWPTFNVFKTVEFPGAFIENVEIAAMAIWIFNIFTSLAPLYLGTTILISDIVGAKEQNYFALPLLPLVYTASRFGESIADVYKFFGIFANYTIYPVILGIPLLVFIGRQVKKFSKNKIG